MSQISGGALIGVFKSDDANYLEDEWDWYEVVVIERFGHLEQG